jgi:hypothetical protein
MVDGRRWVLFNSPRLLVYMSTYLPTQVDDVREISLVGIQDQGIDCG